MAFGRTQISDITDSDMAPSGSPSQDTLISLTIFGRTTQDINTDSGSSPDHGHLNGFKWQHKLRKTQIPAAVGPRAQISLWLQAVVQAPLSTWASPLLCLQITSVHGAQTPLLHFLSQISTKYHLSHLSITYSLIMVAPTMGPGQALG